MCIKYVGDTSIQSAICKRVDSLMSRNVLLTIFRISLYDNPHEGFEKSLYQGCYVDLCDLYDSDKATYDKYIEKFRQKQNPNYDIEQILRR